MKLFKIFLFATLFLPLTLNAGMADKVNAEYVEKIKRLYAPDSRQAVWTVKAFDNGDAVVLKGEVSDKEAYNSFLKILNENSINYLDSIHVYPDNKWGLVRISVAHLRGRAGHSAEIVSQAIMGTPLRLLKKEGEWWRVQSPDGYISYIIGNSMSIKTDEELKRWKNADRLIVASFDQIKAYQSPSQIGNKSVVTDLVNGCIVEKTDDKSGEMTQIVLPDGRKAWAKSSDFINVDDWASQSFNPDKIIELGYSMMGTPYLWGGMSTKSLDCSGFARVCYFANGYILMRDASQQALTGARIDAKDWENCQTGDLLFFGSAKTGKVTHVAIYEADGWYLHSSGRVKRNSVNPESDGYLTTPFFHAVRINGNENTRGITKVSSHPWYFDID